MNITLPISYLHNILQSFLSLHFSPHFLIKSLFRQLSLITLRTLLTFNKMVQFLWLSSFVDILGNKSTNKLALTKQFFTLSLSIIYFFDLPTTYSLKAFMEVQQFPITQLFCLAYQSFTTFSSGVSLYPGI